MMGLSTMLSSLRKCRRVSTQNLSTLNSTFAKEFEFHCRTRQRSHSMVSHSSLRWQRLWQDNTLWLKRLGCQIFEPLSHIVSAVCKYIVPINKYSILYLPFSLNMYRMTNTNSKSMVHG